MRICVHKIHQFDNFSWISWIFEHKLHPKAFKLQLRKKVSISIFWFLINFETSSQLGVFIDILVSKFYVLNNKIELSHFNQRLNGYKNAIELAYVRYLGYSLTTKKDWNRRIVVLLVLYDPIITRYLLCFLMLYIIK